MSIRERSFSGKTLRPAPEIHIEEDGSFGAILTPWGPRATMKRLTETLSDFILSAKNDLETTSPFQTLTCLSPLANTLRAAVLLANDVLYREENKNEYQSGAEVFAFSRNATELCFVQIGQPHLFLNRKSQPLIPLGPRLDLSLEWGTAGKSLPPLPHELIGLHSTSNIHVVSFRPMPGDELIFLSRTRLPASLFQAPAEARSLDALTKILAEDDPNEPFWLGIYQLPVWKRLEEAA